MKLLVIGDVVGEAGIDALHGLLRRIKRDTGADFVIVNGENAAGNGVLPRQADDIFAAGADVITLGNHVFGKQQIVPYLDSRSDVLRPANLAPQSPGRGPTPHFVQNLSLRGRAAPVAIRPPVLNGPLA